jgi:polyketide biosynthesis enoyl-CoA hydratase PksI
MGKVVSITAIEETIALIQMHDKASRNTFTKELIGGIVEAFDEVRKNDTYKVVILTGYDNYFCCGGTQEELRSIYRKEIGFNDLAFFSLPLYCELPVISAMQGHGIGGGFVFGCYSDFIILGKESLYTCNFMKYGFTPGMGGTFIVPYKFGNALGNEMLYTADNYRGGQLQERGVVHNIVAKTEVLNEAVNLAKKLAEKPRMSLITLKAHLSADIKDRLPDFIEKEIAMHEITFHQPEVAIKIESLFGN